VRAMGGCCLWTAFLKRKKKTIHSHRPSEGEKSLPETKKGQKQKEVTDGGKKNRAKYRSLKLIPCKENVCITKPLKRKEGDLEDEGGRGKISAG